MSNPISVSILNEHGEPVLLLGDPDAQKLLVAVKNISGQTLVVPGAGDNSVPAAFRILFRPGTLLSPQSVELTGVTVLSATEQANDRLGDWKTLLDAANATPPASTGLGAGFPFFLPASVLAGLSAAEDFVAFALAPKSPFALEPLETIVFTLHPVRPDLGPGSRPTRIETRFQLLFGPSNTPIQGSELNQLSLVNLTRTAFTEALESHAITSARVGPLAAAFQGSNLVVNDGVSLNGLKIRLALNPDSVKDPGLKVAEKSTVRLHVDMVSGGIPQGLFRAKDATTSRQALTIERFERIVSGPQDSVPSAAQQIWKDKTAETAESQVKADGGQLIGTVLHRSGAGTATWTKATVVDFHLGLFTSAPSGFAEIKITWSDFPDFRDGELVLLAQIGPLFIEDGAPDTLGLAGPLRFRGASSGIEMFKSNLKSTIASGDTDFPRIQGPTEPDATLKLNAASGLEIGIRASGDPPVLTLTNFQGGQGTGAALDFNTFSPTPNPNGAINPTARIEAVDLGFFANQLRFLVNKPDAPSNGLVELMNVSTDGLQLKGALSVSGDFTLNGSLKSSLEVAVASPGEKTVLTLNNNQGGQGAGAALDFNTFPLDHKAADYHPTARIVATDLGNFTNDFRFLVKQPGAANNALMEQMRIAPDASGTSSVLTVNGSVSSSGLTVHGPVNARTVTTPNLTVDGAIIGLDTGMRFIRHQVVLNEGSPQLHIIVNSLQIAGAAASDIAGLPFSQIYDSGIPEIGPDEVAFAHWLVPLNNYSSIDAAMCYTRAVETGPFGNENETQKIGVAVTGGNGNPTFHFQIRVAIFVIVIKRKFVPVNTEQLQ